MKKNDDLVKNPQKFAEAVVKNGVSEATIAYVQNNNSYETQKKVEEAIKEQKEKQS